MIPLVLPAALKALPWRLIGAVALVVAVALMGWLVSAWRAAYHSLQATEKLLETTRTEARQCAASEAIARQVYAESQRKAAETAARDKATAERIERELTQTLAAADARGRDLARRLRDYQARACPQPVPAAADPAGGADGPTGEPGDGDAIERATAAHLSACERDSTRLAGWQEWWAGVSR
jgi:hypothetical protein